ncbi:DUF4936 family protein [Noviherbaspirillum saxi]|uniref:DUF4936 family protein n=1 Tax=Noviherbaspirillum saxi TaxID=2320863 RepID=A0A3A3FQ49_9BURK|nr:DUF4936 family protein [Noviherbaspirillum saxi]RJF95829.1 DUF4936 family protein [Noviherbaspirillum saxi]
MDLYIYYRIRSEHAEELRSRVSALQQCVLREYGIVTRIKRRPEEKDGLQTWMEVYLSVPTGFEATLDRLVAEAQLDALIDGPRHTEHFVDIAPCA